MRNSVQNINSFGSSLTRTKWCIFSVALKDLNTTPIWGVPPLLFHHLVHRLLRTFVSRISFHPQAFPGCSLIICIRTGFSWLISLFSWPLVQCLGIILQLGLQPLKFVTVGVKWFESSVSHSQCKWEIRQKSCIESLIKLYLRKDNACPTVCGGMAWSIKRF